MRRRILIYTPHAGAWGLRLADAVAQRAPEAICLVVRRGEGAAPHAGARAAVLDLPAVPESGRDPGLRILADVARAVDPETVVVLGEPLGPRGELAPTLAALRAVASPPKRFLALTENELGAMGEAGGGRALRALLAWYDHALVFAERDACAALEPAELREGGTVALSYVGGSPGVASLDRAARQLLAA
ncbi:MAG: hypothetical protein QOI62_3909 [Solirubrobacteraceae bacterium]|nr:hypothetical protein [Solirubrobacteraceae bacterium]